MPQLRFNNGSHKGQTFKLEGDQRVVLGRESKATLRVPDNGASREHAEIFRVGEMVFVRDMGSRNGTFVNEERIQEELLRLGDTIRVGTTQIVFEAEGGAGAPPQDVQYDESENYSTSFDLKVDDLLFGEAADEGHAGQHFRAICQATQLLHSERDEERLAEGLLDIIREHMPADYLYLFLRDPASGLVVPRASRQKKAGGGPAISRTILKRVIADSRAILTADAMQDERFKTGDSVLVHQIRAVLCVPVLGAPEAQGALYAVNSGLGETFDQSDLELLTAIGTQLGAALGNLGRTLGRRRMFLGLLGRVIRFLEEGGHAQGGHAERVSQHAAASARELNLPDAAVLSVSLAGLLHDAGAWRAPRGRGHTTRTPAAAPTGLEFLRDVPGMDDVLPILEAQQERWDGKGAPKGLKGEEIPLGARILAVAHAFDARLWPPGGPPAQGRPDTAQVREALTALLNEAGSQWDAEAVGALVKAYQHGTILAPRRESQSAIVAATPPRTRGKQDAAD